MTAQEPEKEKPAQNTEQVVPPPPPPPLPPPKSEQGKIYSEVEGMPILTECAGMKDRKKLKKCNQESLARRIDKHLAYPAIAKDNGVEGTVLLTYVVGKDGSIRNIKIKKDIGAGCGKAAKEALEKASIYTKYRPGIQKGKVAEVAMKVQVEFNKEKFGQEQVVLNEEVLSEVLGGDAEEEIFKVVEDMPRFPGCEDEAMTKRQKQDCSRDLLLEYVAENIVYPEEAKNKRIEGIVVVTFIVNKEGQLNDIKVLRNIGAGCGQAAIEVFEKMNKEMLRWTPGKQRGNVVNVSMTVPVKFKLEQNQKKD